MKKRFVDDLARSLATPMPRRDALRTLGASLAMGLFPWLRATAAVNTPALSSCPASVTGCGGRWPTACCITLPGKEQYHSGGCYAAKDTTCCTGNGAWLCGKPSTCGATFGKCIHACPAGETICVNACCKPNQFCQGNQCYPRRTCTSQETICGQACCGPGTFCGSPNRNLCCTSGDNACLVPQGSGGTCCKPGQNCCFTGATAKCCEATQVCKDGECKCGNAAGVTPCGNTCCSANEVCSANGKCCPKGKSICGKECCDAGSCCSTAAGDICCPTGQFCGNIPAAPGNMNCCPAGRMAVTSSGVPVCCDPGLVATEDNRCCPPGKPNCCDDGDLAKLCPKNAICSNGECREITPPRPDRFRRPTKLPPRRK